jgi:hypothetical protein
MPECRLENQTPPRICELKLDDMPRNPDAEGKRLATGLSIGCEFPPQPVEDLL